jgi:hypothetical protein
MEACPRLFGKQTSPTSTNHSSGEIESRSRKLLEQRAESDPWMENLARFLTSMGLEPVRQTLPRQGPAQLSQSPKES